MDPLDKYYVSVIRILTLRPRSEKEIREYLVRKKASQEIITTVIAKVQGHNFQSDLEFARWWVQSRTRYKAKSDLIITMELRQKGISDDLIKSALLEKTDDHLTDEEKIKIVLQKYFKKVESLPKYEQYRRMSAYLSQKGFNYDAIRRAIDDILERGYNRS